MDELSDISSASDEFESLYVRPKFGRTLICGSKLYKGSTDRRQRYQVAIGIDQEWGPGVDLVMNLEDTLPYTLGHFAHVDCLSVLEHSRKPWSMAANVERLLDHGGTLHVAAPFAWRFHGYPSDYWRFTTQGIRELFPNVKWAKLVYAIHRPANRLIETVKAIRIDGYPYFNRAEVYGFGVRV